MILHFKYTYLQHFLFCSIFTIIGSILITSCSSLKDEIEEIRVVNNLPALGVAVIKDGVLDQLEVTGFRSINSNIAVSNNDRWHIGSLTKGITATLAAILVKEGQIKYSTTIKEVLPQLNNHIIDSYLDISLQELLNQTAGLSIHEMRIPSWEKFRVEEMPTHEDRIQFSKEFLSLESNGERGTFRYANGHYIVAGTMLEAVTGITWETLVTKHVFNPLNMLSVGFGAPGSIGGYDEPLGHLIENDSIKELEPSILWDSPKVIGPSGTLHSSLTDYSKFVIEHLNGFKGKGKLLTQDEYNVLHTSTANSEYAMGWREMDTRKVLGKEVASIIGDKMYMHGGSNGYWIAGVFMFPHVDMGVVIVANIGGQEIVNSGMKVLETVMKEYFGSQLLMKIPKREKLPSCSKILFPIATSSLGAEGVLTLYHAMKDSLEDIYSFGPGELTYIGHYYCKKTKEYSEAIKIYQLEAKLFPKQGQGDYYTATYCYLPMGDTVNAIKYYNSSINKQPEFFKDEELEALLGISEK